MRANFALVVVLALGCGGVSAVAPDASGAAGDEGAAGGGGQAGAAAGTSGAAGAQLDASGAAGGGGTSSAGAPGPGGAGAGGSAGSAAGAAGASAAGATGAAGTGAEPKPWCLEARPADWAPTCASLDTSNNSNPTIYPCGGPGTGKPAKMKTVGPFNLACGSCVNKKGVGLDACVAGSKPTTYPNAGTTVTCFDPTTYCVANCAECP